MSILLEILDWLILGYFVVVNVALATLLVSAAIEMRAHRLDVWRENRWRVLSSEVTPTISVLAPAHNEARTVSESVRSLLTLRYPSLEVVLINDGSTDATLDVLRRDFDLVRVHSAPYQRRLEAQPVRGVYRSRRTPALVVVDKENGGKADALNVGLDIAGGELVCAIDSDTLVEADALQRMIRPFLVDDRVLAVGGTIRAVNGCDVRAGRVVKERAPRKPLEALQAVEYLRAFLAGRLGWNRLGGAEALAGHHAPLAAPAGVLQQPPKPPDRGQLAVTEALEERHEQQPQAVAQAPVAAIGPLLQRERERRQREREPVRDDHEQDREPDVHGVEREPEGDRDDAEDLDHRREQFHEQEVRDRDHPHRAVARIERESQVPAQDVGEAAVPAVTLTAEHLQP